MSKLGLSKTAYSAEERISRERQRREVGRILLSERMSPAKKKKMAQHRLKMAEKKTERRHRKRGVLRPDGHFYKNDLYRDGCKWTPGDMKRMGGSIPGGIRRKQQALKS